MDLFTYLMAKKGHNTHRDLFSYLLGSGNKLPSEYQRLEYIESTGTQYINTGRIPSNNEDVKIKCFITPDTIGHPVYGAFNKTNQSRRHIWSYNTSSTSKMDLGWGVAALCSLDVNFSNILNISAHFQAGNQKLTVNGSSNSSNSNANTNPNLTAYLFARHNSDGAEIGILMRLYSCKIYDNGVLVRNFIPCMRISDNEVGLYDTVGEQFYTNQGRGKFAYNGYTFVEYIESTGTQYINTGVINNPNIRVLTTLSAVGNNVLNGNEVGGNNGRYKWGTAGSGGLYIGYGNKSLGVASKQTIDDYFIFDIAKGAQSIKDINGNVLGSSNDTSLTKYATNGILIFRLRGSSVYTGNIRIKNCKFYESNSLIRNFIPCIRNSDNAIGMYDMVNDTFYSNIGTGTFIIPDDVQLNSVQSLNTSLLSNNIQEETNIDDIQEEPNLDDVNEIEEQNDEPIENEEIEEPIEEYQEL